jgi:hypothetical protein
LREVKQHFEGLIKNKKNKFLSGWITRKNNLQINSDNYTKLFDELEQSQRAGVFHLVPNVTFYLIPIYSATRQFCDQLGIKQFSPVSSTDTEQLETSAEDLENDFDPHCFAWICKVTE